MCLFGAAGGDRQGKGHPRGHRRALAGWRPILCAYAHVCNRDASAGARRLIWFALGGISPWCLLEAAEEFEAEQRGVSVAPCSARPGLPKELPLAGGDAAAAPAFLPQMLNTSGASKSQVCTGPQSLSLKVLSWLWVHCRQTMGRGQGTQAAFGDPRWGGLEVGLCPPWTRGRLWSRGGACGSGPERPWPSPER